MQIISYVNSYEILKIRKRIDRLDKIYAFMFKEAGYTPKRKLVLKLIDEVDYFNGSATVIPRPVVEIFLSHGSYANELIDSDRRIELIAIHEFTHILNMELSFGARYIFQKILGRVMPDDPFSMLMFYLTCPSQMTMPGFWLEGTAQWAETEYSPKDSIWSGRGRNSLVHMIWRLDAYADEIPKKKDWRSSYIHWPGGAMPYNYGLAYTRYLHSAYGKRASIWELAYNQARNWPWVFNRGTYFDLSKKHDVLIEEARKALKKEQIENINILKQSPLTSLKRTTPVDFEFGAPAWTKDGRLFASCYQPYAKTQKYVFIDKDGKIKNSDISSYEITGTRRSPKGTLVTSNLIRTIKDRYRSQVIVIRSSGKIIKSGLRMIHPDLAENVFTGYDGIAAVRFTGGGEHELRLYKIVDDHLELIKTVPAEG